MKKQLLPNLILECHNECQTKNSELLKKINNYCKLGAIPHCEFPEICKHVFLVSTNLIKQTEINLFSSYESLKRHYSNNNANNHYHIKFKTLAEYFNKLNITSITFRGDNCSITIKGKELKKLINTANQLPKNNLSNQKLTNIKINSGSEIIFSTPETDLPIQLLQQLKSAALNTNFITSCFIFETNEISLAQPYLVIGIIPNKSFNEENFNIFSIYVSDIIEKFLPQITAIDFLVLNEKEIIDVVKSVGIRIL